MINLDNLSPFDDHRIRQKQKITASASFKAFNSVATRLLGELSRIFPEDVCIRTVSTELQKISTDRKMTKVGASAFFREIRNPSQRDDGSACQYVDLLVAHSDRAFAEPIPVGILQESRFADKWKDMSPELRNALWEYLDRLVHLSAQAMFSNSTATDEMNRLSRAVVGASMAGQGKSAVELSGDPGVQKAADDLICRIR